MRSHPSCDTHVVYILNHKLAGRVIVRSGRVNLVRIGPKTRPKTGSKAAPKAGPKTGPKTGRKTGPKIYIYAHLYNSAVQISHSRLQRSLVSHFEGERAIIKQSLLLP